jgi:hypothetical protein
MISSPDIPHPGQAYAAPRVRVHHDKTSGKPLPAFVYPYQVVKVQSRQDLELALEHYGALPTMENANTPKTPEALRFLIEWTYPALRWFCRSYQVAVPAWLQGNGFAGDLAPADFVALFGNSKPLRVQEWHEDKRRVGQRA